MNEVDLRPLIVKRQRGEPHTPAELKLLADAAATGSAPDYQIASWLQAEYLNPVGPEETVGLTRAMAESGSQLDRSGLPHPWLEKHSTGGVGDKTSIALLPVAAAIGIPMIKLSGRGLGFTGGTIDKLESIPGFNIDLSADQLVEQAKHIGLALGGQTASLAPADKTLYALRDATATVDSLPLIVSSILSKKIASGAEAVALDVKCGSGSFCRTLDEARRLARELKRVAAACGLEATALITDMDQPLGTSVGNALEVAEAFRALSPASDLPAATLRFRDLVVRIAGELFALAGRGSLSEGMRQARAAIASKSAQAKAQEWIRSQGGDDRCVTETERLQTAKVCLAASSAASGFIHRVDARAVGEVVQMLGGGRIRKDDEIDGSVGVEVLCLVGDRISTDQVLFRVHARSDSEAEQSRCALWKAFEIRPEATKPLDVVIESH